MITKVLSLLVVLVGISSAYPHGYVTYNTNSYRNYRPSQPSDAADIHQILRAVSRDMRTFSLTPGEDYPALATFPSQSKTSQSSSNLASSSSSDYSSEASDDNSVVIQSNNNVPSMTNEPVDITGIQSALSILSKALSSDTKNPNLAASLSASSSLQEIPNSEVQSSIGTLRKYFMNKDNPQSRDIPSIPELQKSLTTLATALSNKEKEPELSQIFNQVTQMAVAKAADVAAAEGAKSTPVASASMTSSISNTAENTAPAVSNPAAAPVAAASADSISITETPSASALSEQILVGASSSQYGAPASMTSMSAPPLISAGGYAGSGQPEGSGLNLPALPALPALPDPSGFVGTLTGLTTGLFSTAQRAANAGFGIAGALGTKTVRQGGIIVNTLGSVAGAVGNGFSQTFENNGDALRQIGQHVTSVFATA